MTTQSKPASKIIIAIFIILIVILALVAVVPMLFALAMGPGVKTEGLTADGAQPAGERELGRRPVTVRVEVLGGVRAGVRAEVGYGGQHRRVVDGRVAPHRDGRQDRGVVGAAGAGPLHRGHAGAPASRRLMKMPCGRTSRTANITT